MGIADALVGVAGASGDTRDLVLFLVLLFGLSLGLMDILLAASGLELDSFGLAFGAELTGLPSGVKFVLLLLLFLSPILELASVGVVWSDLLPKFSFKDNVSVTDRFLSSKVSNFPVPFSTTSSLGPCPKSETRDNDSVTVLFLNSSLSYLTSSARGLISAVIVPDALLDLSNVGVFKGVTPDKRLDLLTGVAGVVDVSARSLSSADIAVLLAFVDAVELLSSDTMDMGTVDALLVSDF